MKSLPSHIFRSGEMLSPTSLRRCYDGIARDLDEHRRMRYTWSQIVVPLDNIADTDGAGEKEVIIKAPASFGAFDITRVEFYVAGTDGTEFTFSISGATGAEDVVVEGVGTTEIASGQEVFQAHVPASTEVTFSISATGTWTVTRCYAVVHVRYDRYQNAASINNFSPPLHNSGDATVAADVDGAFDNYDTDATAIDGAQYQQRIEIVLMRDLAGATAANEQQSYLPGVGRHIESIDWYLVRSTGAITALLKDEAGSTLHTGSVSGAGTGSTAKDQANSVNDTQNDDPDDIADHYTIEMYDTSGSTIDKAYAVLYIWEP